MIVKIEIDVCDLRSLIQERDALRDRIKELEDKPLEFSLRKLSHDVGNCLKRGYTPDQMREILATIESGGTKQEAPHD